MLYVQEKVAKLGDIFLGGQVSSVEIQESAAIYVAQDDKGQVKKTQPVGYDNAKVIIVFILVDRPEVTSLDQLTNLLRLFRSNGQTQAKLLTIVNEDCAARDIFQVYFKSLSSKKVISESRRIVSLELWAPQTAKITVVKKTQTSKSSGQSATSENQQTLQDQEAESTKAKGRYTGGKMRVPTGSNSIKTLDKSPAKDTRNTTAGKKAANKAVKHTGRNTA